MEVVSLGVIDTFCVVLIGLAFLVGSHFWGLSRGIDTSQEKYENAIAELKCERDLAVRDRDLANTRTLETAEHEDALHAEFAEAMAMIEAMRGLLLNGVKDE